MPVDKEKRRKIFIKPFRAGVSVFLRGKAMLRGRAHLKAGCVIQRELIA